MKYGRLNIPIPKTFVEDKEALQDLYKKGEITREDYFKKLRNVNKDFLLFIAQSNSYNPSTKRRSRETMSQSRSKFTKAKTMEIAQQLNDVVNSEPETQVEP